MKLGRFMGLFLMIMGAVFSWFAFSMIKDAGFTIKMFLSGPALFTVGIAFLFFPGGNITAKESREKTKDPQIVFSEASNSHKIAWGIATVMGVILSYLVF